MSKLKIAIIAPGPESEGGIRSVVDRIIPRINAREDFDVTWIATHRTGSAVSRVWCFLSALVKALVVLPGSSVAHIHGSVGTSLLRKSIFIWIASACRCHLVYHFHASKTGFEGFFNKKGVITAYSRAALNRCERIVVLSDTWMEVVKAKLPNSDITVIYNPVLDLVGSDQQDQQREPVVLYLAHLISRKGYQDLIRAFAGVIKEVDSARLVFCGSGEIKEAMGLCDALGISSSVEFHGWVSAEEKVTELARAMVFSLPSYDEGLPMGILEAMSAGVPIIATPVGGIPDVLKSEENALLVDAGDTANLRIQLTRLLTQPELRSYLAANAKRDSEKYHPDRICAQWVELYRELSSVCDRKP